MVSLRIPVVADVLAYGCAGSVLVTSLFYVSSLFLYPSTGLVVQDYLLGRAISEATSLAAVSGFMFGSLYRSIRKLNEKKKLEDIIDDFE